MRGPALSQRAKLEFLKNRVWIMGVLNATPDSFYPGSRTPTVPEALAKANQMIHEGADLLDIGGESTRPGSDPVPIAMELERILPIMSAIRARWPEITISIDTQ